MGSDSSAEARAIWTELIGWAERWRLPEPRVSAGWIDLPPAFAALARDGWIIRPLVEPPATADDEAQLVRETGIDLPDDLRALYRVHDGSFAQLLPQGMTLLPYAAMLTTWRSLALLADEFNAVPDAPISLADAQTHLGCVYHRRWLPIANADELNLMLDFVPGPKGVAGQVLMQVNECDYVVVSRSISDFLRRWLRLLRDGTARFDATYGYAISVDDIAIDRRLADVT